MTSISRAITITFFTLIHPLLAQSQFIVNFNEDDQGNTLVSGIADLAANEPYRNFFENGLGIQLSTNDPANNPLNIYDTEGSTGQDGDLERNSEGTGEYDGGSNVNAILGNALIINRDTVTSTPNDQASGGNIILDFDIALTEFGFDFVDLDQSSLGSIIFTDSISGASTTIEFVEFEAGGTFEQTGVLFGDRNANEVRDITAANVGLTQFDQVVFSLTGSGAIGNLFLTTVPEPSSSLLTLLGASALCLRRKRSA